MSKSKALAITIPALFTALIVIMAQFVIPIQPVPFSFAIMAIFITGAMLEPKQAFFAVLAYIILGAIGLPVFAGQKGGLGVLLGSTGGFIFAYPFIALITAVFIKHLKIKFIISAPLGMLIGTFLCYLIGSLWFTFISKSDFIHAVKVCALPFIPLDILKMVISTLLAFYVRKALPQFYGKQVEQK